MLGLDLELGNDNYTGEEQKAKVQKKKSCLQSFDSLGTDYRVSRNVILFIFVLLMIVL